MDGGRASVASSPCDASESRKLSRLQNRAGIFLPGETIHTLWSGGQRSGILRNHDNIYI